jgi:hypothetical protein
LPEHAIRYPFHVEHVIARKHGGSSSLDNLAWACIFCNVFKGSDIASLDPDSGKLAALFNPRQQIWEGHFDMTDGVVTGKTPSGRATVMLLQINSFEMLALRQALIQIGQW